VDDQERTRVAERFAAKVETDGDHQVWAGATSKGLGIFKLDGRPEKAPRVAWLLAHGSLPAGALKRTCDRAGCVAPAHHHERVPTAKAAGRHRPLPRGSGHIRQRSSGSHTVEIVTGVDPLDRRRKFKTTFTVQGTYEDAVAVAEEYRTRARLGDRINLAAKGTFGELLDLWFEHARIARSTRRTYRGYIDNHIKPALGAIPLRELSTFHLDPFYQALAERGGKCRRCWWLIRQGKPPMGPGETCRPRPGASERVHEPDCVRGLPLEPATERQVHAIIHRALAQAKKWKLITSNPADDTTRSPVPMPEVEPPKAGDVARVLNTAFAKDRQIGVFGWMTMITQGRRGEAAGIRWSALDLDAGVLRIRGALEGDRTWKPPKNNKGRSIRLDPLTIAILVEEREEQEAAAVQLGLNLRDDGWLFADPRTPDGSEPVRPDLLAKRFRRICDQLRVVIDRNLYGLRHFGATDLVTAGVDIRTVAGRLGNDPAVTLRRYAHLAAEADRAAVTGLAERMAAHMAQLDPVVEQVETCPHGHPWTKENTYRNPATGGRVCRECDRARHRRPVRLRAVADTDAR
jgi:integrase